MAFSQRKCRHVYIGSNIEIDKFEFDNFFKKIANKKLDLVLQLTISQHLIFVENPAKYLVCCSEQQNILIQDKENLSLVE